MIDTVIKKETDSIGNDYKDDKVKEFADVIQNVIGYGEVAENVRLHISIGEKCDDGFIPFLTTHIYNPICKERGLIFYEKGRPVSFSLPLYRIRIVDSKKTVMDIGEVYTFDFVLYEDELQYNRYHFVIEKDLFYF